MKQKNSLKLYHRFLDEAGDTTFYKKGKIDIVGTNGVSKSFMLGMVQFNTPIEPIRAKVVELQRAVINDAYFAEIPSIQKKINRGGFYFHAKDDVPEVRKLFYDYINSLDCHFEAVLGRKSVALYQSKHNGKENEFYADLLSHLLDNKLGVEDRIVLNIAARGKTTKNKTLESALQKATARDVQVLKNSNQTRVTFNVQNHYTEPLLNIADYFCWSIQRLFERGETRYYNYLKNKVSSVKDLYDNNTIYSPFNPLTKANYLK